MTDLSHSVSRRGSRILERWGVGDKLAVRSSQVCAPGLGGGGGGGLKACPLRPSPRPSLRNF